MTNNTTNRDPQQNAVPESMTTFHLNKPGNDLLAVYQQIAHEYDDKFAGHTCPNTCVDLLLSYLPQTGARVMDAGSGTGLAGPYFREMRGAFADDFLVALDFSPDMLDVCSKKRPGVFNDLLLRDFTTSFKMPGTLYDGIMAAGVFLDNHVGPKAIINIAEHLRPGGAFVLSVREKTFNRIRNEYERYAKESNCEIAEVHKKDYGIKDSPLAYYLVLKKKE